MNLHEMSMFSGFVPLRLVPLERLTENQVVVRKSGREVAEHQGVWPKTRVKGDYIKAKH